MPLDRRTFLTATPAAAPVLAATALAGPAKAEAAVTGQVINARDLGVMANSASDQTATLQAAIDRAAAARLPLFLPPGGYGTGPLTLRDGTILSGAGQSTRLVAVSRGPVLAASAAGDVSVRDLSVTGLQSGVPIEGEAPPLIDCADIPRLLLDGVAVDGGDDNGISLARCGGTVRNCRINASAGTGLFSIDATGLEIIHNAVQDCGNNGIQVWRSTPGEDGTIVAHNRIRRIRSDAGGSGQYGNGVNVFRAGAVLVTANRIEDCTYSAVRSNAGSDCQILGNSCSRLGEVAIYAEFGFEGAVIANNLVNMAATGIVMTNFNEGGRLAVCSGNIVRNLFTRDHYDRRGNGIGAEADTAITGNVVENAPEAGISIGWGHHQRNVSAANNIVRDCGVGISVSVVTGAGTALLTGNLIATPKSAAIQGYEWANPIGGDLIDAVENPFPNVVLSGNARG